VKREQCRLSDAPARVEADRILGKVGPDEYLVMRERISTEKIRAATENLASEHKKESPQGILTSVNLFVDESTTHRSKFNFQTPIVSEGADPCPAY
jgi:hypothetical protein